MVFKFLFYFCYYISFYYWVLYAFVTFTCVRACTTHTHTQLTSLVPVFSSSPSRLGEQMSTEEINEEEKGVWPKLWSPLWFIKFAIVSTRVVQSSFLGKLWQHCSGSVTGTWSNSKELDRYKEKDKSVREDKIPWHEWRVGERRRDAVQEVLRRDRLDNGCYGCWRKEEGDDSRDRKMTIRWTEKIWQGERRGNNKGEKQPCHFS